MRMKRTSDQKSLKSDERLSPTVSSGEVGDDAKRYEARAPGIGLGDTCMIDSKI